MKNIYKIDIVVVAVSLTILIFLIGYIRPLVIAPLDNYETTEIEILFSIEKADTLLIDDNYDFTTPDEYHLKEGLKINLAPGKYYWKVKGLLESDIKILTIVSEVKLELREINVSSYGVFNTGNIRLNVDIYNGTEFIGSRKIDTKENLILSGNKFIGGADE
jgi:hypothetical protein